MEKSDRRPISLTGSLTGIGLIASGAVLGLALAAPAAASPSDVPRQDATPTAEKDR